MRRTSTLILGLFLLLVLCLSASAQQYDLTGKWIFAFEVENGPSFTDPCTIQQQGEEFNGAVVYQDNGNTFQEPFSGRIHADGSLEFVLYDAGNPVQHWGQVGPDGNTVTGTWSFDDGSGTFTLTRQ